MEKRYAYNKQELIELLRAEHYEVTPSQFDRWRRGGLLPSPEIRSLGRGKGTGSFYPLRTREQLLRLCEIHLAEGGKKRLPYIAWQLWWEGYDIQTDVIRQFLSGVALAFDQVMNDFKALGPEERSRKAGKLATKKLGRDPGYLAKARQHLRGDSVAAFQILADAIAGEPLREDPEAQRLLEKGTGIDLVRKHRVLGRPLVSENDNLMTQLGPWLGTLSQSLTDYLAELTDDELIRARDELQGLIAALNTFAALATELAGKRGLGVGDFRFPEDAETKGVLIIVWKAIQEATTSAGVPGPAAVTEVITPVVQTYPVIQELRKVDGLRELLGATALLEDHGDPVREQWRIRQIQSVARSHPEDISEALARAGKKRTKHGPNTLRKENGD